MFHKLRWRLLLLRNSFPEWWDLILLSVVLILFSLVCDWYTYEKMMAGHKDCKVMTVTITPSYEDPRFYPEEIPNHEREL